MLDRYTVAFHATWGVSLANVVTSALLLYHTKRLSSRARDGDAVAARSTMLPVYHTFLWVCIAMFLVRQIALTVGPYPATPEWFLVTNYAIDTDGDAKPPEIAACFVYWCAHRAHVAGYTLVSQLHTPCRIPALRPPPPRFAFETVLEGLPILFIQAWVSYAKLGVTLVAGFLFGGLLATLVVRALYVGLGSPLQHQLT